MNESNKAIVPLKSIGIGKKESTHINISLDDYLEFSKYLSNLNIRYDYEDLYNFSNILEKYNKIVDVENHKHQIEELSLECLFNVVKENNKKYKEVNRMSLYKELEDEKLKIVCELIINTIKEFLNSNKDISPERIKCVLSDLKILNSGWSLSLASVTYENMLILSPNMIGFATMFDSSKEDVLIHEIIHLLQKGCHCLLENNESLSHNYGFCYGFKDTKINSIDFSWFYEASAEKNMSNYTGHKVLTYKNMIAYLDSFSFINLLNSSFEISETLNLSFKRKLKDLFEYFSTSSDEDQNEVLKLMYSLEILLSKPEDFFKELSEKKNEILNDEFKNKVRISLRLSTCKALSKMFYNNIAKSLIDEEITLQDIFYLISLFENDISEQILYSTFESVKNYKEFIIFYKNIQDELFKYLSVEMNIDIDKLVDKFINYTSKLKDEKGTIVNNYDLKFLSDAKREFLNTRESLLNYVACEAIRKFDF